LLFLVSAPSDPGVLGAWNFTSWPASSDPNSDVEAGREWSFEVRAAEAASML